MKKFIKYFFLATVAISVISVVWYEFIASDETKLEMEIESIGTSLSEAESISDIDSLYSNLANLQKQDSTGMFIEKIDSIFSMKSEHEKRIKDKMLSTAKFMAYSQAKEAIKAGLKAPSSAKFAGYNDSFVGYNEKTGMFNVQMWVEAQNSFGVMLRKDYVVKLQQMGNKLQAINISEK